MLNVCFRGGDAALLRAIREVTLSQLGALMDEIVVQGVREGVFLYPAVGRHRPFAAHAGARRRGRGRAAAHRRRRQTGERGSVIDALNVYRDSVELLLNAPYGSVRLFDVDRVLKTCRALLPGLEAGEEEA